MNTNLTTEQAKEKLWKKLNAIYLAAINEPFWVEEKEPLMIRLETFLNTQLHQLGENFRAILNMPVVNIGEFPSTMTPLALAVASRYSALVELLLKKGANPNEGLYLHLAIKTWNQFCSQQHPVWMIESVVLLIQYGADVIVTDENGITPKEMLNLSTVESPGRSKLITLLERAIEKQTKQSIVWDMWVMESSSYNHYLQWLPREMVEDTDTLAWASDFKDFQEDLLSSLVYNR